MSAIVNMVVLSIQNFPVSNKDEQLVCFIIAAQYCWNNAGQYCWNLYIHNFQFASILLIFHCIIWRFWSGVVFEQIIFLCSDEGWKTIFLFSIYLIPAGQDIPQKSKFFFKWTSTSRWTCKLTMFLFVFATVRNFSSINIKIQICYYLMIDFP